MKIIKIQAREILASGGEPTVEVKVVLENGVAASASVSYGASAGSKEAVTLLDGDKSRYNGNGMLKAVANVNEKIAPLVIGNEVTAQRHIDQLMIEADKSENKAVFGANAILGVSMAVARAAALSEGLELYNYLAKTFNTGFPNSNSHLPKPLAVFIEGGKHADNSTDFQEYALAVVKQQPARENIRMMEEIYQVLKKILKEKNLSVNVGNEGAFAPSNLADNELPIAMISQAIVMAGYFPGRDAGIYLDPASSEFYRDSKYILETEKRELTAEQLIARYGEWFKKYPIVGLEDGLSEFDWASWPLLLNQADKVIIVADDLTVSNVELLQQAINQKVANAILIKLNQAGTVTETMDCCTLANKHNFITIPSHRGGGESNDTFLVDLAVAVGSAWIKVGPTRGERVCKYNRLMEIEDLI